MDIKGALLLGSTLALGVAGGYLLSEVNRSDTPAQSTSSLKVAPAPAAGPPSSRAAVPSALASNQTSNSMGRPQNGTVNPASKLSKPMRDNSGAGSSANVKPMSPPDYSGKTDAEQEKLFYEWKAYVTKHGLPEGVPDWDDPRYGQVRSFPHDPELRAKYLPKTPWGTENAPVLGDTKLAKVVVAIYSNFNCDECKQVVRSYMKLKVAFGEDVALVYRHVMTPGHPDGHFAAISSIAAQQLAGFWKFHDLVFGYSSRVFHPGVMEHTFTKLGVDLHDARRLLYSLDTECRLEADDMTAYLNRITVSPTFLINGKKLEGVQTYEQLSAVVRDMIYKVDKKIARGMSISDAREEVTSKVWQVPTPPKEPYSL